MGEKCTLVPNNPVKLDTFIYVVNVETSRPGQVTYISLLSYRGNRATRAGKAHSFTYFSWKPEECVCVFVSCCSVIACRNFTYLPWKGEQCVYVYYITSGNDKRKLPKKDTGSSSGLYTLWKR
jgi:hypothetical protein